MRVYESYAEALYHAAGELGILREVYDELPDVSRLIEECAGYMHNPQISSLEKADLMQDLFADHIQPLTLQLILFMVRRHHSKHLPAVAERYHSLCAGHFGRPAIRLRIPYMPEPGLIDALKGHFAAEGLIPRESLDIADIQIELDESILGGFIAYRDGMQIDASLKSALMRLDPSRRAER